MQACVPDTRNNMMNKANMAHALMSWQSSERDRYETNKVHKQNYSYQVRQVIEKTRTRLHERE